MKTRALIFLTIIISQFHNLYAEPNKQSEVIFENGFHPPISGKYIFTGGVLHISRNGKTFNIPNRKKSAKTDIVSATYSLENAALTIKSDGVTIALKPLTVGKKLPWNSSLPSINATSHNRLLIAQRAAIAGQLELTKALVNAEHEQFSQAQKLTGKPTAQIAALAGQSTLEQLPCWTGTGHNKEGVHLKYSLVQISDTNFLGQMLGKRGGMTIQQNFTLTSIKPPKSKLPFITRTLPYDIKQSEPGDKFDSIDEAAIHWARKYNGLSISKKREYGSAIYKTKDNKYAYNKPNQGVEDSVSIPKNIPENTEIVADIHSHSNYHPDYRSNRFSKDDHELNEHNEIIGYISTPSGKVRKYNPKTAERRHTVLLINKSAKGKTTLTVQSVNRSSSIISNEAPSDPNDPARVNNIPPEE